MDPERQAGHVCGAIALRSGPIRYVSQASHSFQCIHSMLTPNVGTVSNAVTAGMEVASGMVWQQNGDFALRVSGSSSITGCVLCSCVGGGVFYVAECTVRLP